MTREIEFEHHIYCPIDGLVDYDDCLGCDYFVEVNYPPLTQGASCFIPLPTGSESTGSRFPTQSASVFGFTFTGGGAGVEKEYSNI